MTTEIPKDANELLMSAGVKSAKFHTIGDTVSGEIIKPPTVQQMRDFESNEPLFYEDGNPKLQIVVTLQTDEHEDDEDDGIRNLYMKPVMQSAVRTALSKAGVRKLEVGGRLTVTYSEDRPNQNKRLKPTKLFKASYIPPAKSPNADGELDVEV